MKDKIEEILKKYPDQQKAIKELATLFSIELPKPIESYQLQSLQNVTEKIEILDTTDNIKYTSENKIGSSLVMDRLSNYCSVNIVTIETPYYKIKKSIPYGQNNAILEEILTFSNKKYEVEIRKTYHTNISSSYNNNVEILLRNNTDKSRSYKPIIFTKGITYNDQYNTPDSGYTIIYAYYNSPQYNEKTFPISQDNRTYTVYENDNSIIYISNVCLKKDSGELIGCGFENPREQIYSTCFENAKYVKSRVYIAPSLPGIIGTPLEWKTTQAGMVFYIVADNITYYVNIYKDDKQITIDIKHDNPRVFLGREHKIYTIDNLQTGPITPDEIDKIIDVTIDEDHSETRYLELMQNELIVFKNKILEKNKKARLSNTLLTDPKYYAAISLEKYADIIKYDINKIINLLSKEYVKEAQKSKIVDQEHQKVKTK